MIEPGGSVPGNEHERGQRPADFGIEHKMIELALGDGVGRK
jgi:hypothetical protein